MKTSMKRNGRVYKALQFAVLAEVFFAFSGTCGAQSTDRERELLEFVRDAHRASRESIRTCSCRVEFTIKINRDGKESTQSCSSRFWVSPEAMRAQVSDKGDETDYLWKDSVRQSVTHKLISGQKAVSADLQSYTQRHQLRSDPWVRGQLVLNVPATNEYYPFEELVQLATKVTKVMRDRLDGKETILVQLFFDRSTDKPPSPSWDVEIHFDPSVNFLVRKKVYRMRGAGGYSREEEIIQFKEWAPGLFFPERIEGRSQANGIQDTESLSQLSDIKVNDPLPDDIFRFRYPNGVFVADGIRGTEYRADAEGNRLSAETPLGRGQPPPQTESDPSALRTETLEGPRSLTRWILPASVALLLLAGIAAIVRRQRMRAAQK